MPAGKHSQKLLSRLYPMLSKHRTAFNRSRNIRMIFRNTKRLQILIFFDKNTVGIAGRKMLIIQNPQLHPQLFALVQNPPYVLPPALPAEILMRARFQTNRPYAGFINTVQLRNIQFLALPMQP